MHSYLMSSNQRSRVIAVNKVPAFMALALLLNNNDDDRDHTYWYWAPIVSPPDIVAVALHVLCPYSSQQLNKEKLLLSPFTEEGTEALKRLCHFPSGQSASVTEPESNPETMELWSGAITSILVLARLRKCLLTTHSFQVPQEHHDSAKTKMPDKHVPVGTCVCAPV